MIEELQSLGLNPKQALVYECLLQNNALSAVELMKLIGESRTNTYMILDGLEEIGLVSRLKPQGKTLFAAENPLALKNLSRQKRKETEALDTKIEAAMPALLQDFYALSEKPGALVLEGKAGLEQIYDDTLAEGKTIYLLRSRFDDKVMTSSFYAQYRKARADQEIKTYGLFPEETRTYSWAKDMKKLNIVARYYDEQIYDEPVEIDVYGDKIALLSFGKEVMGVIIESPFLAKAVKALIMSMPSKT